jgi:glycosyltransferase involved in cell wall biosynthesis
MASGTPVVASNVSSLPEVAGDAALLVDPHDPAAIAAAIEAILGDAGLAERLRLKGFERARHFSWEASIRRVREIYAQSMAPLPATGGRKATSR